ncbi:MAG: cytochrome c oxidase subunit 3 [Chitinophagales bacterium]|nr:cytochrome c oxidase subunit 3 [Chitinophagales bacterium]
MRHSWIHPRKFAMWAGIVVMSMAFAGLTSAYLVRKGAGNWTEFVLPTQFAYSAIIMLMSSVSIWAASWAFRNDKLAFYRLFLFVTLALSMGFMYSQYLGWQRMKEIGIYIDGNPSGSFVYVISYLHVVHVAMGILCIFLTFVRSLWLFRNPAVFLIYRTDGNKRINIELLATYWHFVDVLWLYLLVFFMFS